MESGRKVVQPNRSQKIQFNQTDQNRQARDLRIAKVEMAIGSNLLHTLSRSLTPRSTQTRQDEQFLADSFRKERAAQAFTGKRPTRDGGSKRMNRNPSKDYNDTRSRVTSSQESVKRQPQMTRASIESSKQKTYGSDLQMSLSTKINPHESRSRSIQPQKGDRQGKMQLQFVSPLLKASDRTSKIEDHYQCKSQFKNTWSDLVKLSRAESPSASSRNPLKSSLLSPPPMMVTPFNFKVNEKPIPKLSTPATQSKGYKVMSNQKGYATQQSLVKKPEPKPVKMATTAKKQKESRNLTPPSCYSVKDSKRFLVTNIPEPIGQLNRKIPTVQPSLVSKSRLTTETLRSTANLADSLSRASVSRDSSWQHKPSELRASSKQKEVQSRKYSDKRKVCSPQGAHIETTTDSRRSESNSVGPQKLSQPERPKLLKGTLSSGAKPAAIQPTKPTTRATPTTTATIVQDNSQALLLQKATEMSKQVLTAQPPVVALRPNSQISAYAVQTFRLDLGKLQAKPEDQTRKSADEPNQTQTTQQKRHHRIAVFFTPFVGTNSAKLQKEQQKQLSMLGVYTSTSALVASLLKKSLHHLLKSSQHFPDDLAKAFCEAVKSISDQCRSLGEAVEGTELQAVVADSSDTLYYFSNLDERRNAAGSSSCWIGGKQLGHYPGLAQRDLGTQFAGKPLILKTFKINPPSSSDQHIVLSDTSLDLTGIVGRSEDMVVNLEGVMQKVILQGLSTPKSLPVITQTLSLAIIKVSSTW